jgi:DNA-binding transcriptional ArsR family regulator
MTNHNADSILTALADPTRRQIIDRLRVGPLPVRALADALPVSRPAVSQHLKVLSDAGLLTARREGTRRIYALCPDAVAALRAYLDGLWADALENFAEEARKQRNQT